MFCQQNEGHISYLVFNKEIMVLYLNPEYIIISMES